MQNVTKSQKFTHVHENKKAKSQLQVQTVQLFGEEKSVDASQLVRRPISLINTQKNLDFIAYSLNDGQMILGQ